MRYLMTTWIRNHQEVELSFLVSPADHSVGLYEGIEDLIVTDVETGTEVSVGDVEYEDLCDVALEYVESLAEESYETEEY